MKLLDRLSPHDRARASEALARGLVGPERLERAIQRHLQALEAGRPSDLGALLLQESAALAQSFELGGPGPTGQSAPGQRVARLGPYLLLRELGRGGMGRVFRARHAPTGREVALKVLNEGAGSEEWARFQREAITVARLQHPNVVPILDYGEAGGRPYLALELVEGETLAERIKRTGALPGREAVDLAEQLARALAAAHDQGVLHRDLKPANVLLRGRQALLSDFGLARSTLVEGARLTATGMVVGTPAYMAPEQVRGGEVDHRADIYGLGATLYEMLTGRPPYVGQGSLATMTAVLESDPPPPRSLRPQVDPDLERICLRCLHKDPAQRYPDAAALVGELGQVNRASSFVLRAPSLVSTSLVALRRRARALVLGLTLLAVALGGIALGLVLGRRGVTAAPSGALQAEALAAGARAALAQGQPGRASSLVARALAWDPGAPAALAVRSRLHLAQGLLGPALVDAQRATAGEVPPAGAWLALAAARTHLDPRAALEAAERALGEEPDEPEAALLVARLRLLARGDRAGARAALEVALQGAPGRALAWELSADLAEAAGDLPRVRADLGQVLALAPGSARTWERVGRLLLAAGEPAAAEAAFEWAARLEERPSAHEGRARARVALADWAGAEEDLTAVETLRESLAFELRLLRAQVRFRLKDGDGMREDVQAVQESHKEDPRVWVAFALAQLVPSDLAGDQDQARAALDRARGLGEPDAWYWVGEALLAIYQRRREDADSACTRAIELDPRLGYAFCLRGATRWRAGRLEEAQKDLRRGLELEPGDAGGWINLGTLLLARKDAEGALQALRRAIEVDPQNSEAWFNLGMVQAASDQDEALHSFQHAARLAPGDGEAWSQLARQACTAQRYELAVDAATRAMGLGSHDPGLDLAIRGLARVALGQTDAARLDLSASLEIARPEDTWADQVKQALARLR